MYTHLVILRCILYAGGRSGSGTTLGVYHSLKRIGGRGSELSPYEVALMKVVGPFRLMPRAGLRVGVMGLLRSQRDECAPGWL